MNLFYLPCSKHSTSLFVYFPIIIFFLIVDETVKDYQSSVVLPSSAQSSCSCRKFIGTDDGIPAYTALTFDNRFGPPLIFSIRHMSCSLPDDWIIMLIAPASMRVNIIAEFEDLLKIGKLRVWELSTTNRTLREICLDAEKNTWCNSSFNILTNIVENEIEASPWPLDWNLNNELCFSTNVHHAIPTKYFLIFQTDGLLCRPLTLPYIEELRQFDYVGAPWASNVVAEGGGVGGNGGFSFRNRDIMIRILNTFNDNRIVKDNRIEVINEDIWFSAHVHSVGGTLPPLDFAKAFSVETTPFDNPFGFHKAWKHLSDVHFNTLTENCPVITESLSWNKPTSNQNSSSYIRSCDMTANKNFR
jgi:hypothetical protein